MKACQRLAVLVVFISAQGTAIAQAPALQNVTVRTIVCPQHGAEQPNSQLVWSSVPAASAEKAVPIRSADGLWTFNLQLAPGTYVLDVGVPYRDRNTPGCSYLTAFTVLRGHDRHLVGAVAAPTMIGGEGYNRSIAGTLPFDGMFATIQNMDYPDSEEPISVDGRVYDAENLGPARYLLRFYLTENDMEGNKFASFEYDFRHTAQLTHIERAVTLDDLRERLQNRTGGRLWGERGRDGSSTYQIFSGSGQAVRAVDVALADMKSRLHLSHRAADLGGYVVDVEAPDIMGMNEKMRYYIEFNPKVRFDANMRPLPESGTCMRDGRPHAAYVIDEDLKILSRNLCVLNP